MSEHIIVKPFNVNPLIVNTCVCSLVNQLTSFIFINDELTDFPEFISQDGHVLSHSKH
jgi:hypothetical protein